ncbi:hypothetical protein Nepgr_018738 [Nepenthes gracilis]|uniref:Uncharacterized protein n=1 Tax=Nepenthes gracilis TaxID=150966 RepID=A0AAD3STM2_NEPGR|nr:hypothetical protein Nepgr_018738 [Nepenthes gracilis]
MATIRMNATATPGNPICTASSSSEVYSLEVREFQILNAMDPVLVPAVARMMLFLCCLYAGCWKHHDPLLKSDVEKMKLPC